jgi:hypothetical protein
MDGVASVGVLATYSRGDHAHPSDTSRAPLASPLFTGTISINGSPFATIGSGSTQIFSQAGSAALLLSGAGDPTNYYRNTVHKFQAIAGGSIWLSIDTAGAAFLVPPTAPTPTPASDSSTKLATTAFVQAAVAVGGGSGGGSPRPNLCTNPGMQVWQNSTSLPAMAHRTVLADGWLWGTDLGASVWTGSRSLDVPDISVPASINVQVTTADGSLVAGVDRHIRWAVYGKDFEPWANSDIIVKFWVKAKKTGISSVVAVNEGRTHCYAREYTVNVADTWEEKTVTFPFASKIGVWNVGDGYGIGFRWSLSSGSLYRMPPNAWTAGNFTSSINNVNHADSTANYFRITKVQVYAVSVPSFVLPTYDDALASALRQYRVINTDVSGVNFNGYAPSSGSTNFDLALGSPMMAPPAVSIKGVLGTDVILSSTSGTNITGVTLASFARSKWFAKWTIDKAGAFTPGTIYITRLETLSGKLVLDGHLA